MTDVDWAVPETAVMDAVARALDGHTDGDGDGDSDDDSDGDRPAVLATVVAVQRSAYRRPGAKMVVGAGEVVGAVTAGCLEAEAERLAAPVRADGEPRVERFDLNDDERWGVRCSGVVDVLFEPLDSGYRPVVDAYARGDDVAVLTVLDGDGSVVMGDRALAVPAEDADGDRGVSVEAPDWPASIAAALEAPAVRLLAEGASEVVTVDGDGGAVEVFVDSVTAPPELVIVGDGRDVAAVADLARRAGFRVTVVAVGDAPPEAERFDAADRVVATPPADVGDVCSFDGDTYALLMSHDFAADRAALDGLLDTPVAYVGLLGPRKRFEGMRADLEAAGRTFDDSDLDRVYAPAGLSLGGDAPLQVAQSLAAEVTAVHHGRDPTHLSAYAGPIHARSSVGDDAEGA